MVATAISTLAIRIFWFHVTLLHGAGLPSLIAVVLVVVAVVFPAWAIGHAVGTPESTFNSLGRSKGRWIGWMVALFVLGDISGLLLAIYYLVRVRPQIRCAV
jgi:hypothetical protein